MFKKMVLLVDKIKLRQLLKIPVRYKNPDHHWSVLKKKKSQTDKALNHFDEFYSTVYGNNWEHIRAALLNERHKYVAVVNNFSDTDIIRSELELLGAVHLKSLYEVHKENTERYKIIKESQNLNESDNFNESVSDLVTKAHLAKLESIYPEDHPHLHELLKSEDTKSHTKDDAPQEIKLHSIEQELNDVQIDHSRVVDSNVNLSLLQEYIPATKIKGLDDWVLESDQFKFYTQAQDFKIEVVKESTLSFPEHLHVYTFEGGNFTKFPHPPLGPTGVRDYYLFDGASILPVLALDIQPGDVVLDMCAAPGGKALAIIQTLYPRLIVANDNKRARVKRIEEAIAQFLSDMAESQKMVVVTEKDGRVIDEKNVYNKILVDVPCTTDRHSLHSNDNNIFKPSRIKERLQLPQIQTEILTNALKLVTVGGTVVYSTCTLSPIQNDGVVQVALKKAWEEAGCVMVVKDMSEPLLPFQCVYNFGKIDLKYGHIVVPSLNNNWGPMYFCKMVKVR